MNSAKYLPIAFVAVALLGSFAQAATYTWTATGTANWNSTNWSGAPPVDPATGPTAADDAVFNQTTARVIRMVGTSRAVNTFTTATNALGITFENAAAAAGSLAIGTLTQRSASSFQFRNGTGLINVTATNLLVESGTLTLGTTATGDAASQWLNSLAVAAGTTLSNGTINVNVRNSNNTANTYDRGLLTVTAGTVNLNNSITAKGATANVQGLTGTGGVITGASGTSNTGTTTLVITAANDYASGARLTNGASGGLLRVIKSGSGTQTLTGTNSYTGGTLIEEGVLQIGDGGTTGSVAGAITNNAALIFNRAGAVDHAGVISGTGGLTKRGGGTLTISGANSYGGATVVEAGALLINGDQSAATGDVTVSALASFGGTGTIGGSVTVNGTLAPGSSPGTLTFNQDLVLLGSSTSIFDINGFTPGLFDLVFGGVGSQTVTFGGTLSLHFADDFNLEGSVRISDFENYSGSFDSVETAGLADGYGATFDNLTGVVTVVPEPSTVALLVLSAAGLAVRIVRCRRGI